MQTLIIRIFHNNAEHRLDFNIQKKLIIPFKYHNFILIKYLTNPYMNTIHTKILVIYLVHTRVCIFFDINYIANYEVPNKYLKFPSLYKLIIKNVCLILEIFLKIFHYSRL